MIAPLGLSPHDAKTLYLHTQMLFRSRERGDTWQEIRPDWVMSDASKISLPSVSIQHCTIAAISKSPK